MRVLWLIPFMIVLIVGTAMPILASAGVDSHPRAAIVAAVIVLLASTLSVIPLWLTRTASLTSRVQAGLVATVVHMMVAAALCAVEMRIALGGAFLAVVYWLLPLYWSTLIILVIAVARTLRRSSESPNIASGVSI